MQPPPVRMSCPGGPDPRGSVVNRWMMRLVHRESGLVPVTRRHRRGGRSGAGLSFTLSSLRTARAFLMSDHAPGCGRCASRPDPRNGLQQLLSPLLRSFLARQTSCLQPSCAALRALRLRVGRPGASDRHQGRDGRGLETANGDYHGPDRYLHPRRRRRVRRHHQELSPSTSRPASFQPTRRPTTRPRTCGCWWATSR